MELKLIDSIKSRESLIFIETIEEEETIGILKNVSATINHSLILWDANNGFKDITPKGAEKPLLPSELNVSDLNRMFKQIEDYPDDAIFVIKDTKYYVNDRIDPKELAKLVRKTKRT